MKHDIFCRGPFPDGRGRECAVQVAVLDLPDGKEPHPIRHLSGYMCSTCADANIQLRSHIASNSIPWRSREFRAAVMVALEPACRVFPHMKNIANNEKASSRWAAEQAFAVRVGLSRVIPSSVLDRVSAAFVVREAEKREKIRRRLAEQAERLKRFETESRAWLWERFGIKDPEELYQNLRGSFAVSV